MARPMQFTFTADSSDVEDATDRITDSLEDVDDGLSDVERAGKRATDGLARDADRAGDRIGDSLEGGFDDGKDAAREMERSAGRDLTETQRDANRAGDRIGDDLEEGFEKGGEAASDLRTTAGEAIGDIARDAASGGEDIGDSLIDGISAASMAIPGIAGVIGGAVSGIAAGAFEAWRESAERTEARTVSMYEDMIESGESYLSLVYYTAELERLLGEDRDKTRSKAETAGVEIEVMAAALAGNASAMSEVLDSVNSKYDELAAKPKTSRGPDVYGPEKLALEGIRTELEGVAASTDTAEKAASDFAKSLDYVKQNTPELKLELDTTDAEGKLDAIADDVDSAEGTVTVDADTDNATQKIKTVVEKSYKSTVTLSAETGSAAATIANFINRKRTAVITAEIRDREGKPVP